MFFKKIFSPKIFFKNILSKNLFLSLCLFTTVLLSILIRILPLQWGWNLSEFDPYFQYDVTKHIVDNGFSSWFNWRDTMTWYPYGRDIASSSFPGLPFTAASVYFLISFFGLKITLMDLCIAFPVIMAALTCIVAYFFGKEIGGPEVGLLSSIFMAVTPAFIERTNLGFFDDETVGIFAILCLFLFYMRSLNATKNIKNRSLYAILSGIFLGYLFISWGAALYPFVIIGLSTLIIFIFKKSSKTLLLPYGITIFLGLLTAIQIPKYSLRIISEFESVFIFGVFILLLGHMILEKYDVKRFFLLFVLFLSISAIIMWQLGVITLPFNKFISVINPAERIKNPLIESVQEHRPTPWPVYYYQFGLLTFLTPIGIMFCIRQINEKKIFLLIYAITAMYFSASMVRLTIIAAPIFAVLSGITIFEILRPFSEAIFKRFSEKRKDRLIPKIGKFPSIAFIFIFLILISWPLLRGIDAANSPTTVASSLVPIRYPLGDWSQSLVWIKDNLPKDAVIASWWDYGYWLSIISEKITLADNGTINGTQIAKIGEMFMSNETHALQILRQYDVSHVVLFTTINLAKSGPLLYGDEVKWRWMAKIAGMNDTALEDITVTSLLAYDWAQKQGSSNPLSWLYNPNTGIGLAIPNNQTVFTKLLVYGALPDYSSYLGIYPTNFELVFTSSYQMVLVYKVHYN